MSRFLISLGAGLALLSAVAGAAASGAGAWVNPPADCRILKIIHGWPDAPDAQDGLVRSLQAQGFGGVVCNVSFADYLNSPERWSAFRRAVEKARSSGMAMWLYDERGYPSGSAGGQVMKGHPDWEAEGLLGVDRVVESGRVELGLPPGAPWLAAAYPVKGGVPDLANGQDLSGSVKDSRLVWDAPAGRWHVLGVTRSRLYEGTHAEGNLHEALPYPNLLRAEPTARFIELTHRRYARELGPDLGKWFMGLFTDEPSLMSMYLRRMPWRPLPWSPGLAAEFQRRRGWDLGPALPGLFLNAGTNSMRVRHDFWLTVGELVSENYFGQLRRVGRELGVPSGGHLLAEEGLTSHVALYGDFFACLRQLDAPSIDCLTSVPAEVPWHIARLAASAADLEGRSLVMCEVSDHGQVWRAPGDDRPKRTVTEAEIRGTCNRLVVGGVNNLTSYYSFAGLEDAALVRLNEWVGRCCAWMRGGRSAGTVAVVYPAESLAAHFAPGPHWALGSAEASRIDVVFRAVLGELFANRQEFTVIDSRTLREGQVRRGALEHGSMRWRAVVLPGVDTMPAEAWDRVKELSKSGGLVLSVGAAPTSDGRRFPEPRVMALAQQLPEGSLLPAGQEMLLLDHLATVGSPDLACDDAAAPLRVSRRRIEGKEVFLVVNDSGVPWHGRVRFAARGRGERMDPATGQLEGSVDPDGVDLALGAYGAMGFRFPRPAASAKPAGGLVLRAPDARPIAVADPVVSRGEWVREDFVRTGVSPDAKEPAWQARAVLAKGGVDTFLFVRFPVRDASGLGATRGLAFDVCVPPGQSPATQLLVVVQEEGGGEFLGSTPCSLAASGPSRILVPYSSLTVAGWSKDADGVLDPARIREIRIGWGGYHGTEGERIEFSTGAPFAVQGAARARGPR